MRRPLALGVLSILALLSVTGRAGPINVKGRISGQDKLTPEVYAEAQKIDAHRWVWREPSPSVSPQWRALSANASRDICIAAMRGDNTDTEATLMKVTGGRVFPTTIVVAPKKPLSFKNFDPFRHRLYIKNKNDQIVLAAENTEANQHRMWTVPGPGIYEVRDELFPSVRTFVVVDKEVAAFVYPGRDGAFGLSLPAGDYTLKAFFNGRQVGEAVQAVVKERGPAFELKDPLNVAPKTDAK